MAQVYTETVKIKRKLHAESKIKRWAPSLSLPPCFKILA